MTRTTAAMMSTAGTNMPDTLSAILAIGAFEPADSLTILIIWARVVSSPTFSALHVIKPERFIVPAETLSPGALSTGTDSPVRADSSTAHSPSLIIPSTGICPPGLTTKISPATTSSTGTVTSSEFLMRTAVFGWRFRSALSAFVVRPLDIASRSFPMVISVTIMAADSK